jgi:hypothetical protein
MAAVAEEFIDEEAYRDSIATVDENGKRIWLYPKSRKVISSTNEFGQLLGS